MRRVTLLFLCAIVVGCARHAPLERPDRPLASTIPNADVERAFKSQPAFRESVRVAVFSPDTRLASAVATRLLIHPAVSSVHRISPLLITGQRRFDKSAPTLPLDIDRIRLAAARAHADVLLVIDYAARTRRTANGLAATAPLLIPLAFAPMQDVIAESYIDGYVFDTLSGYEYGELHFDRKEREEYITIYSEQGEALRAKQRHSLLRDAQRSIDDIFQRRVLSPMAKSPGDKPVIAPPPADTTAAATTSAPHRIAVTLQSNTEVRLGDERIWTLREFVARVRERVDRGPTHAVVRVTDDVGPDRVAEVLALLRGIGVREVRLHNDRNDIVQIPTNRYDPRDL